MPVLPLTILKNNHRKTLLLQPLEKKNKEKYIL